jgi:hypothetical protein
VPLLSPPSKTAGVLRFTSRLVPLYKELIRCIYGVNAPSVLILALFATAFPILRVAADEVIEIDGPTGLP